MTAPPGYVPWLWELLPLLLRRPAHNEMTWGLPLSDAQDLREASPWKGRRS